MIDEIGKQAITVHVFIDKIQHSNEYSEFDIPHTKMRIVKKVINTFLRNMKNSEYYYLSDEKWGDNFYDTIIRHVDDTTEEKDNTSTYLTWIQYQFHRFIKEVFPQYYDTHHRIKRYKNFYKKTLETLLR